MGEFRTMRQDATVPSRTGLLEVIVTSVEEALEADRGGAGRLEVVRNLELGGLTPSVRTVQDICQSVGIPVRVMLRCTESHTPSAEEVEQLSREAEQLAALDIDGLVVGFLRNDQVDLSVTRQVLGRAPDLRATFHRAFDETAHPLAEIERLKELHQVDRILTSGGDGSLEMRAKRLERYQQAAAPEITILAGGGLDRTSVEELMSRTQLREFHTCRAVRVPDTASGMVRAQLVRELVACLPR